MRTKHIAIESNQSSLEYAIMSSCGSRRRTQSRGGPVLIDLGVAGQELHVEEEHSKHRRRRAMVCRLRRAPTAFRAEGRPREGVPLRTGFALVTLLSRHPHQ